MSLVNAPSKEEVMGWNTQTLADYMRQLNLSSCDSVVLQSSITGAQFIHMSQSQMEVFPSLYLPILTNIQREINTEEQRKNTFGLQLKTQRTPKTVFKQDEEVWNSDEFDSGSDDDCESPTQKPGEENYICPSEEPETAEEEKDAPPAWKDSVKPRPSVRAQDCHREESLKTPRPYPRRMTHSSPPQPLKPPVPHSDLQIDRSKKPRHPCPAQRSFSQTRGGTVKASGSSIRHVPQPRAPQPADVVHRSTKLPPLPPVLTQRTKLNGAKPEPKKVTSETCGAEARPRSTLVLAGERSCLDPSWYGGNVTRHEAEAALRAVNKDGAFIVRDSSKGSAEHPHTLMLLNQGKIYNIKIRRQGNSYLLGNGFNRTQRFPGVTEAIIHYTNTPLVLIDAAAQSSAEKPQCCLLHPAGL
ncbi:lymphocyte cytosolic protein 2 [Kryptolebias marmoratus]|uniref:lymphocyte cytosolic protein 2 n=1 Tax=Kryptolebias marmoratus TaxID=37003 RepID=UPI0018AD0B18|nr:lymphocyte cytosolic protein 2 [Kryptolebias marmoratus]